MSCLLGFSPSVFGVSLEWMANSTPGIAGYVLYYGTASRSYANNTNVGNLTICSIPGLTAGQTYYFAVTAYDNTGLQSSFSDEISYTVPSANNLLPTIALTSPLDGSTYTAPAAITLAASVTANGHAISTAQFYNGSTLLGTATTAPYTLNWTNVTTGAFVLTAKVLFDSGGVISSSPVSISVLTLPAPWQTADIGPVGVTGSASYNGSTGVFTLKGSGDDIWGTTDSFRFAWQNASGDCDIRARVESVQNTDAWAKAGIMIRETLGAQSEFAAVTFTATNVALFAYRTATAGGCASVHGIGQALPYWVRLVRSGNTFLAYLSNDGRAWIQLGSTLTINMATGTYIGLCDTAHNNSVLNASTFSSVTVTP